VQFIVSGDDDETEVRTLDDPKRSILRRNGVDVFVMAVPRSLGQLNFIRIWHDNSGKGKWKSWFLKYVVFRDVQTGHKFEFVSNRWFAVEEDDGMVDRLLPVAGKAQLSEFSHLFSTTSQKNLTDGHLWFSVFTRPPRSRFTRVQRVSSCMALLYLSMLVNAMWYERTSDQPSPNAVKFGPFSLSPEQVVYFHLL
ncbi:polycystic kidney disease protein 1-like 3, partial [Limulus polyphemus]|uniref:Polycystic kidney disease protein 1-like 3 n=1 Tax=Limulus polyphemus TaxID=6850 RepID=A0ABM1RZJ0_LIMPO